VLGTTPTTSALRPSRRILTPAFLRLARTSTPLRDCTLTRHATSKHRDEAGKAMPRRVGHVLALCLSCSMRLSPPYPGPVRTAWTQGAATPQARAPPSAQALCRVADPAGRLQSPWPAATSRINTLHTRALARYPCTAAPAAMQRPVRRCGALHGTPSFLASRGKGPEDREHRTAFAQLTASHALSTRNQHATLTALSMKWGMAAASGAGAAVHA